MWRSTRAAARAPRCFYAPYGSVRYSSGAMPTDYGFTGQHADTITGLDYYNARYYHPSPASSRRRLGAAW